MSATSVMTRVGSLNLRSPLRERQLHLDNTLKFATGVGEGYLEYGVLPAAVDAAQFATLTGELWTAEPGLPMMPPDDGLGPDRVEREKFVDEMKIYSRWVTGKRETYNFLIKPFGENQMLIDLCKPANDRRHVRCIGPAIYLDRDLQEGVHRTNERRNND